jgi:hypothetical protein
VSLVTSTSFKDIILLEQILPYGLT